MQKLKKKISSKKVTYVLHQAIQLIKNLINHYTTTSMWMLVKASFFAVDDRSFIAIL